MFSKIFKIFLLLMSIAGFYVLYLGAEPLISTIYFLDNNPQKVTGTFEGYEIVQQSYSSESDRQRNRDNSPDYYPKFSFQSEQGKTIRITSSYQHLFEMYTKGEKIDIYLSGAEEQPRIAGYLSLFLYDGLFVAVGSFMMLVGLFFYSKFPWQQVNPNTGSISRIPDELFDQFWERVNKEINLRWIPGFLKKTILLLMAFLIAYTLVVWKPWQMQARAQFLEAAYNGNLEKVKQYITDGYDFNITNDYDQTALHLAVENKHWLVARLLLESGAAVDILSKMQRYPLEWAVQHNDTETALLILERGSPVNDLLTDPLGHAYLNKNMIILEALLIAGADVQKIYPEFKMTLGDIAVKRKDDKVIALIKKYGGRFTR